ncbi:MAG TPA: 3-deoxy-7-phosphoheptulonate synthase [Acidimicrobiia bacterium]|nr:3-deoxy-7-phosphoheptulonate synthase [Acidimicrobiia bacterium]HEU5448920.1 3-deoxy-7-phosphoheptulonate synthase [Acidimicrobiia bacterium]
MIVVMQPEATDSDIEGVTAALARHGLVPSVSRGAECTVIGVIGDVDAAGDLSQFSILPGVDKTVRISAPYKLVSSREGHRRSTIRVGPTLIGGSSFALIAGPCAVETPEQAAEACEAAAKAGATVLRGDVYKHRTSPYAFQGLGAAGLEILAEQKRRFGLPVVAEVLHPQEVEAMVDVVDIFRIGARNMQNFDLLRACSLTGKAVMLKRGLSATIEEWLLAAEYAASSGNLDIILCERGIRTFEPATRNTLDLSAVSVVQQRSHLPVIVDPSHGTGHKSLVAPMTLAAVAGGCDGIMVDVHPHPELARCDGPQALLPDEFSTLAERMWQLAAWMGRDVPPTVGSVAGAPNTN